LVKGKRSSYDFFFEFVLRKMLFPNMKDSDGWGKGGKKIRDIINLYLVSLLLIPVT
jgi:hypothetical protein